MGNSILPSHDLPFTWRARSLQPVYIPTLLICQPIIQFIVRQCWGKLPLHILELPAANTTMYWVIYTHQNKSSFARYQVCNVLVSQHPLASPLPSAEGHTRSHCITLYIFVSILMVHGVFLDNIEHHFGSSLRWGIGNRMLRYLMASWDNAW